jgi:hypothetical protein
LGQEGHPIDETGAFVLRRRHANRGADNLWPVERDDVS